MRWAVVKVSLAVTTMVVLAFAVPLALVVKQLARDRAFSEAERQAANIGPVLAVTTEESDLRRAVATTAAGAADRIAVLVPADVSAGRRRVLVGRQRAGGAAVRSAAAGRGSVTAVDGGYALLKPIAVAGGRIAVVEVFVPDAEVTRGVTNSWLTLGGVGLALVAGSAVAADRLGTRLVRPARQLAAAAHALGEGKLGVRVREEGPPELRAAAAAFNAMADRVVQLLANERELAADLSHRLRTPLTVLRLNAASLGEGEAARHTREAVAQLEREVDKIIRTARQQRERPTGATPGQAGCDAAEVVRERMLFWSALAEDEGRPTRLSGAEQPAPVPVARAELAAALDALLGNVFRHTPEGTAFAVDVHRADEAVLILVSDAGAGIADPDAALRRGQGAGGPGSTGLGLDIVRRLAESTGGDVALGTSVLGGTEVRVRLARAGPPARRQRRRRGRGLARRRTGEQRALTGRRFGGWRREGP